MKTHALLSLLTKEQIVRIARRLELNTTGRDKASLQRAVSSKLGREAGDAQTAVGYLADELTGEQLKRILGNTEWDGATTTYVPCRLSKLSVDKARDLLVKLCVAEQEGDVGAIDKLARSRNFGEFLEPDETFDSDLETEDAWLAEDYEEDEEEESDDEGDDASDGGAPYSFEIGDDALEEDEAEWERSPTLFAGPGAPRYAGLSYASRPLFDHQQRSMAKLRAWLAGPDRSGILCLPTGSGKTRTAAAFALRELIGAQSGVLWLAHRHELVNQAVSAFVAAGDEAGRSFAVGRYEAGARKTSSPVDVLVASIQTLAYGDLRQVGKAVKLVRQPRLLIVDECHHAVARTWMRVIQALTRRIPGLKVLGLTATPTRTAASERPALAALFGGLIHTELPLPLINEGILARPELTIVSTGRSYEASAEDRRAFVRFKELSPALIRRLGDDRVRNELVANHVVDPRESWGQSLVYAATVAQAQQINSFIARTRSTAFLSGGSPEQERRRVIDAFASGRLHTLVSVDLFTEGTDLPGVDSIFIARPTKSAILFQQMVGRGLRGPRVGGTETCRIVGFNDDVIGLLESQLSGRSSSLAPRQELEEVLGAAPRPMAPPPKKSRLALPLRVMPVVAAQQERLAGWWELALESEQLCLPVFDGQQAYLNDAITAAHNGVGPSPETAETSLGQFLAQVVARRPRRAVYREITAATADEVTQVKEGITQAPPAPTAQPEPAVTPPPVAAPPMPQTQPAAPSTPSHPPESTAEAAPSAHARPRRSVVSVIADDNRARVVVPAGVILSGLLTGPVGAVLTGAAALITAARAAGRGGDEATQARAATVTTTLGTILALLISAL